jgi:membrane-associated phospholipid phosphatase
MEHLEELKGCLMLSMIFSRWIVVLILFIHASPSWSAADAPAADQSFLSWVWSDQFKPMVAESGNESSLRYLAGGLAATALSFHYDHEILDNRSFDHAFPHESSKYASALGSGFPGIAIALGQIYWDRGNGLMHARSVALTSVTHFSLALLTQRERPNKSNKLSFPSGHTSSSFATATSLAYAYGPWIGVPAFAVAAFVGGSRVADNAHWFSDTVAGAALGIYWASVSAKVKSTSPLVIYPVMTADGLMASLTYTF